jgi:hypothetical protein
MCRACIRSTDEERLNRHGWAGPGRYIWPRHGKIPDSWKLRHGFPASVVADAQARTAESVAVGRREIDALRAELTIAEELLEARMREAETRPRH